MLTPKSEQLGLFQRPPICLREPACWHSRIARLPGSLHLSWGGLQPITARYKRVYSIAALHVSRSTLTYGLHCLQSFPEGLSRSYYISYLIFHPCLASKFFWYFFFFPPINTVVSLSWTQLLINYVNTYPCVKISFWQTKPFCIFQASMGYWWWPFIIWISGNEAQKRSGWSSWLHRYWGNNIFNAIMVSYCI